MRNEVVLKKIWYHGQCENAWFPLQPIADLRTGVCLPQLLLINYLICIFIDIMKTLKMRFTNGAICTRSIISQMLLAIDY